MNRTSRFDDGRINHSRWLRSFLLGLALLLVSFSPTVGFSAATAFGKRSYHSIDPSFYLRKNAAIMALTMTSTAATTTNEAVGTSSKRLKDVICVVTGASRGIGKGIALELGKEGATVYVTGTSSINSTNRLDEPGTVEETAQEITESGGVGIPVICNHADDQQVRRLFQKIQEDHGRIDILVNNAFRYPPGGTKGLQQKFWHDTNAEIWDAQHTVGLRSHYVASCCAVPMMIQQQQQKQQPSSLLPRPSIVMIGSFGGVCYLFNVAYGVAKAGVDRMAKDMAVELANENISVVSLWPGVVMTERNARNIETGDWYFGVSPDIVESLNLTGKVIVELALDSNNMKKSGTY